MKGLPSCVLILGFLLVACAVIIGKIVFPVVINRKITQQVQIVNGSETFKRWQKVPVPIYLSLYMFNVTNPEEIVAGEKPLLQEVGPYVYRQKRVKKEIKFNKNRTVSYKQVMSYHFEPDLSVGPESDSLTVVNLPLVAIASKVASKSSYVRYLARQFIEEFQEKLFITRSVEQMLFKGYYVPLIASFSNILGYEMLPNNTFGIYYGKNNSDQGLYEVHTGVGDPRRFGEVTNWNGASKMPWWDDPKCSHIKGTDGSLFAPFVGRDRVVKMFSSDLCRNMELLYQKDTDVNGVPVFRFVADKRMLDDVRDNEDNLCYCTQTGKNHENCPHTGAYQINACRKGSPLLVSLPHFLDAAATYKNGVSGLDARRTIHETFIDLEPNTGLMLRAFKRIQLNIQIKRLKFIRQLRKVKDIVLPVFWIEEKVEAPEASTKRIQAKLLRPLDYANYGTWTLVAIGLCCIAIAAIVYLLRARRKKYDG